MMTDKTRYDVIRGSEIIANPASEADALSVAKNVRTDSDDINDRVSVVKHCWSGTHHSRQTIYPTVGEVLS